MMFSASREPRCQHVLCHGGEVPLSRSTCSKRCAGDLPGEVPRGGLERSPERSPREVWKGPPEEVPRGIPCRNNCRRCGDISIKIPNGSRRLVLSFAGHWRLRWGALICRASACGFFPKHRHARVRANDGVRTGAAIAAKVHRACLPPSGAVCVMVPAPAREGESTCELRALFSSRPSLSNIRINLRTFLCPSRA